MSLLALLGNYDNGTSADGPEVSTEFTQLLSALNATSTDKNLSTRFSGSDPTYAIDQLGAGDIAQFRKSGSELLAINNSGQVESSVTTGTAPIIVASTTKVTNLNADLLDGISSLGFLADPGGNGFVDRTAAGTTSARTLTGTANQVSITNGGGGGNPVFSTPQSIHTAAEPTFGGLNISAAAPFVNLIDSTGGAPDFKLYADASVFHLEATGAADVMTVDHPSAAATFTQVLTLTGGAVVGTSGTAIKKVLEGTASIDPPSIITNSKGTVDFTITGAAAGDWVFVEPPAALEAGLIEAGVIVTAPDTATLTLANHTSGTVDGASRTWRWIWYDVT